jgi:hypothetical protein
MQKREAEFSTYRSIKILICSWNIDSCKPSDLQSEAVNMDFLTNAVQSGLEGANASEEPPEIIVFGFQEVVNLSDKKIGASKSAGAWTGQILRASSNDGRVSRRP